MIVNGKEITEEIKEFLKQKIVKTDKKLNVVFVSVGENFVANKFVNLKQKFAYEIGVKSSVKNYSEKISEDDLKKEIEKIIADKNVNGIVVQLPLPMHINTETILNLIPKEKDIDILGRESFNYFEKGELKILPPVVGAIKEIFDKYNIDFENKKIVVVGKGKLVGLPVSIWLSNQNIEHKVLEKGDNILKYTKNADIIISGVGSPNLINIEMIKNDVILIDAGTSELNGQISGDIDKNCFGKASLFLRVPGGIGPITIAVLFKNLIMLQK